MRLQRHLGDAELTPPGQWHGELIPMIAGYRVTLCCPLCGDLHNLGDYTIDGAGRVVPAFTCPSPGCGFYDWIDLDSWNDDP